MTFKKAADLPDDMDLDNEEFLNAYKLIRQTNAGVYLTGRAGTGKSTFLKYIVTHVHKKYVLLAPTGIAAVNIGGVTLHSFFRIPLQPLLPDDTQLIDRSKLKALLKYNTEKITLLKELQLIVIDEASMIRADILDFIDLILRTYCNPRLPFGGKQLLLVGDLYQLEPVVKRDEWELLGRYYKTAYFFEARAYKRLQPVQIELRKVYRQKELIFLSMLDRVRLNTAGPRDLQLINSRCNPTFQSPPGQMYITLTARRITADNINQQHLSAMPEEPTIFEADIKGDFPESSMPTNKELTLKTGAQIVFVKNDPEHRWYNGTIAQIESIDNNGIQVITEHDEHYLVEPETWENNRYRYNEKKHTVETETLGTFSQLPVKLAWAITIHKSQGLTFEHIIIDLDGGAFANGQAYVALSRCTTLDGLVMRSPLTLRDIHTSSDVIAFSDQANDKTQIDQQIDDATATLLYSAAATAMHNNDYMTAVDNLLRAVSLRPADVQSPAVRRLIAGKLRIIPKLQSQLNDARKQLQQLNDSLQDFAQEYFLLAVECKHKYNDNTAALANLNKALRLAPCHIDALLLRAGIRIETGEYDDAIYDMNILLDQHKDNTAALRLRATAHSKLRNFCDAESDLRLALRYNDREPETYRLLAAVCRQLGETQEADQYDDIADGLDCIDEDAD